MGLKLQNEFTVAAPFDETWSTLLDIARVARCMPGAKIEPGGEDGIFRGTMKMKLGPMNVAYQGTARMADVDADARICTLSIKAKEQRGQGTASATITNRLTDEGTRTKVVVETDLAITGRQAQFGRGIMEDVSAKMLADFAQRLEREVLAGSAPEAADGAAPAAAGPESTGSGVSAPVVPTAGPAPAASRVLDAAPDDVLDLGDVVSGPLAKRAGIAAAAAVTVSALAWALTRRGSRKGFELRLRYR
jgi:carbon monoxide dehydrogenase subunit G